MTKTYRSGINAIGLNDTEKDALTARLNSSLASFDSSEQLSHAIDEADLRELTDDASADSTSGTRRTRRLVAAVAGALALTLAGTTAYAVSQGFVSVPDAISAIMGEETEATDIVEKVGSPVGVSATSNGVTITAETIVGDKNAISIVYSMVRVDGKPFDGFERARDWGFPYFFDESNTGIPSLPELSKESMSTSGGYWFYDANPDDPAFQFVEQWSYSGVDSIIGRTYEAHFKDLMFMICGTESDENEDVLLASGDWKLTFPINFTDTTREVNLANTNVKSADNEPVNVTQLELSSLAFRIVIEMPGVLRERWEPVPQEDLVWVEQYGYGYWDVREGAWDASGADGMANGEDGLFYIYSGQQTPDLPVSLKMKDGSILKCNMVEKSFTTVTPNDDLNMTRHEITGFLPQIVDVDDVEAIIVGGAEIPMK
ncbi:MAG: DUF4179 domain-containing protein [Actinomycetaceae bacterium]|nr:DUF4179 domain-containing protein [Actinomycetaceae bacterium]